tara:strand:- start:7850 stop:8353 length:504 start_codon:yes stop_codon:yes gene_type:complete
MHEYISNYRQVTDEQAQVIVDKVVAIKGKNILEIDHCAGFLTLRFSEVCDKVTAIDRNHNFFSPSLQDHVLRNNISNIHHMIVESEYMWLKENNNKFDVIYIHDIDTNISDLIKNLEKDTTVAKRVIYRVEGDITHKDIKPQPTIVKEVVEVVKTKQSKTSKKTSTD